ncbi:MAG TPA: S8 family serine peptidase, partial [Candidatus Sumerlaeota bacterium]|nr:S8 family serine peptidase [Candidatus Sumerlaeota bacterium]
MRGMWRFIVASLGAALLFCGALTAESVAQSVRNDAVDVAESASSSGKAQVLQPGVSKPTSPILAGASTVPLVGTSKVSPVRKRPYAGIDSTAELESRHVLVRFAASVDSAAQIQALSGVNGAKIVRKYTLVPGLALVEIPATQGVNAALEAINQSQQVLYAEPNYVRHLQATPNDPRFGDLWGLYNIGQSGGTKDDDIDATEAWDRVNDASDIIVADVDSGMDYTHPDLAGNRWVNPGEIPGNGIDDDGNGYVDDVYGYDAINGDGDPMDDHGHGSHTAGTIGALGNN